MARTPAKILKSLLCVAAVTGCLAATPALAQVQVQIYPPAAFIAVNTPVYYEGRATYWYGNRWYYRDGRSWRAYHQEPVYLHEYRGHHPSAPYHYERSHGGDSHHEEHSQRGDQH